MDKRTYSHSGLRTFNLCAYAWYLEYVKNYWNLGNYYTLRGHGVHKSRELNFLQKRNTRKDLLLDECEDIAFSEIKEQVMDEKINLRTQELIGLSKIGSINKIFKDIRPIIKQDYKLLYPQTQPLYVEQQISIELPDEGFDLRGIVDIITEDFEIIDAKTSGRRMTEKDAKEDMQVTIYSLLGSVFTGKTINKGFFDVIYTGKKIQAYRLAWVRSKEDIKALIGRFRIMHEMIEAGTFPPCDPGSWKCDPRWCGHYTDCPYV